MDLHDDPIAAEEQLALIPQEGGLPLASQIELRLIPGGDQQVPGLRNFARMNEQVQVAELPERNVSVDGRGEGRSLERDRADAASLEQIQETEQFFGQ